MDADEAIRAPRRFSCTRASETPAAARENRVCSASREGVNFPARGAKAAMSLALIAALHTRADVRVAPNQRRAAGL